MLSLEEIRAIIGPSPTDEEIEAIQAFANVIAPYIVEAVEKEVAEEEKAKVIDGTKSQWEKLRKRTTGKRKPPNP